MKKYLITSREFYTDTPAVFRSVLHEQLSEHLPDFALYRDKSNPNYEIQAEHFVEVCSQFESVKSIIHRNIKLAKKLNAYGVHLTSSQFDDIKNAKDEGLKVFTSTHSLEDLQKVSRLGADFATYSPIFKSPNKGEPKGLEDLKNVLEKTEIKIFALGGIVTEEQVKQIEKTDVFGFASIRYFY